MRHFLTWLLLGSAAALFAAGELEDLRGLELARAKLPVYNKDRLQLMVFGSRVVRKGRIAEGSDVTLDIIRRNADVDAIKDGWNIGLYPLRAPLADVLTFWGPRLYSEGVMFTARADVDQESRTAAGQEPVFFRSPLLDLDGIGFEADFDKRTISVREEVNIILRFGESDPRKLFEKQASVPERYEFLHAVGDSLLIDMLNNRILLIGNVRIDEERSTIDCDRMTIFLDRKDDETLRQENAAGTLETEETLEGVSRIAFDGGVAVRRKLTEEEAKDGAQEALADHMVYDIAAGTVTMLRGTKDPVIRRGAESISGESILLHRAARRAQVRGGSVVNVIPPAKENEPKRPLAVRSSEASMDYDGNVGEFSGDVVVDDPRMKLECSEMRIHLREQADAPIAVPKDAASELTGFTEFTEAGGQRELDNIECAGNVLVTRRDAAGKLLPSEQGSSQKAVFDYATRKITMSGGTPTLKRKHESLSGDELDIYVDSERIAVRKNSRIVLSSPGGGGQTVILSDTGDFDNSSNKLTFTGKVRLNDPRMQLECDRMEIFLADAAGDGEKKENASDPLNFDAGNSGKTVEKAVCFGQVHMKSGEHGDLFADQLTLLFEPVPEGAPQEAEMFASNGTRLVKVLCDGNFKLVSNAGDADTERKAAAKAERSTDAPLSGMLGAGSGNRVLKADRGILDLVKNESEFHGHVDIRDELSQLTCDDMFIYTAKSRPEEEKQETKPAEDDPDADPFADRRFKAEMVPARIMLTDGLDLERILCTGNVHLARKNEAGQLQQAFGERAEYVVADKRIVLTGTPAKRPMMTAEGGMMRGDRVVVDTATGNMRITGRTQLERDGKAKLP